ncbi:acyl carrier protein [Nocardia sp. NPDC127579]|uniref:acyl carrier protein n=1 Tax=Nocardia sp. NPDC127579 TaxID=3345402 RepID=UPI003634CCDE
MSTSTLNKEDLRELVADTLDVDLEQVTDKADFLEELGVDSLMSLEVAVQVEKKLGLKITEEELKEIRNFQDVCTILDRKISA